jgi:hypothetical protein
LSDANLSPERRKEIIDNKKYLQDKELALEGKVTALLGLLQHITPQAERTTNLLTSNLNCFTSVIASQTDFHSIF